MDARSPRLDDIDHATPGWRPEGCDRVALVLQGGGALGAYRGHRDWARITNWALVLVAPVALHAAFDFPLLALQRIPDLSSTTRLLLGSASVLIGFSSIGFAIRLVRRLGKHHAPRTDIARERLSPCASLPPGRRTSRCRSKR